MSTSKQVYHLKYHCVQCGELLHYKSKLNAVNENDSKTEYLFCVQCDYTTDYIFKQNEIYLKVDSDRRKEKHSIGKAILKEHGLSTPVMIDDDRWLVYDIFGRIQIFYLPKTKKYELKKFKERSRLFDEIGGLLLAFNMMVEEFGIV